MLNENIQIGQVFMQRLILNENDQMLDLINEPEKINDFNKFNKSNNQKTLEH